MKFCVRELFELSFLSHLHKTSLARLTKLNAFQIHNSDRDSSERKCLGKCTVCLEVELKAALEVNSFRQLMSVNWFKNLIHWCIWVVSQLCSFKEGSFEWLLSMNQFIKLTHLNHYSVVFQKSVYLDGSCQLTDLKKWLIKCTALHSWYQMVLKFSHTIEWFTKPLQISLTE